MLIAADSFNCYRVPSTPESQCLPPSALLFPDYLSVQRTILQRRCFLAFASASLIFLHSSSFRSSLSTAALYTLALQQLLPLLLLLLSTSLSACVQRACSLE